MQNNPSGISATSVDQINVIEEITSHPSINLCKLWTQTKKKKIKSYEPCNLNSIDLPLNENMNCSDRIGI